MKWSERLSLALIKSKLSILAAFSKRKAAKAAFSIFSKPMGSSKQKKPGIFKLSKRVYFKLGNHKIWGYIWNKNGNKKVLILHGFNSNSGNFHHFITPLIQKHYEVAAFDAPAHGQSGGTNITALDYKAMIQETWKEYGPFQACIAHSFGGLALSLALEDIPHDESLKVVLIAPATETTTAVNKFFENIGMNGKVKQEFFKVIEEVEGKPASWYSIRRAMKNIKASVYWLHDKYDGVTPIEDAMKVVEDNHPNLRFGMTKRLGHRHIYRNDHVVEKIVEFL
jgi:esterase/lipase